MHIHGLENIVERFTDKCRKLINEKEKEIEELTDLELRNKLKDRNIVITGGVIFEMAINRKLIFYKTYRKLEKQYDNAN